MDFITFQNMVQNHNPQDGIAARFYDKAIKTDNISKDGLPIFINRCFVEIRIKDNNDEVFDQPATADKIHRFPVEYARYQLGKKQVATGTPLEQFAFLTAAEIESLKVRGIFTVEALAQLDEQKASQLDIEKERDLAKKFLANAKNNQALLQWQKKEESYKAEIEALQQELENLKKASPAKRTRRKS